MKANNHLHNAHGYNSSVKTHQTKDISALAPEAVVLHVLRLKKKKNR